MTTAWHDRMRHQRGLTLIEVAIVSVMLAVVVVGGLAAVRVSMQYGSETGRKMQAAQRVGEHADRLRNHVGEGGPPSGFEQWSNPFGMGAGAMAESGDVQFTNDAMVRADTGGPIGQYVEMTIEWDEPN